MRMGTLYYGDGEHPIEIDDVILAHLKVVISTKLRRSEGFTLSWVHDGDQPLGRSTIWLHPSIPLRFHFDQVDQPQLDPHRIAEYAASANNSGGIFIPEEHILGFNPKPFAQPHEHV